MLLLLVLSVHVKSLWHCNEWNLLPAARQLDVSRSPLQPF